MIQIQSDSGDTEQLRARLRKMTDLQLREFGRAAREVANLRKSFGAPNPAFQIQLGEAKEEWRRRHPKLPLHESA